MLRSIDLKLRERLQNREFRIQWYRAQLEASVPDMFRELREARSLTQKQLAAAAEMKQSAISRFEKSDEANWKIETLLKLADALDAQLSITLTRSEDVIERYKVSEPKTTKRSSVFQVLGKANVLFDETRLERSPKAAPDKTVARLSSYWPPHQQRNLPLTRGDRPWK